SSRRRHTRSKRDWSSDVCSSDLYEVEETEAETGAIYTGLSTGDIDVFMDSWFPNQKQYVEEYSDDIEDVAVSYDDADSGMVVPEYMDDIEDVGDLKGKED